MPKNEKESKYPEVEIYQTLSGLYSFVKIDGEEVRALRSINVYTPFDDITTITLEILGRVSTRLRGKVNVIETVYINADGKEIKIGEAD